MASYAATPPPTERVRAVRCLRVRSPFAVLAQLLRVYRLPLLLLRSATAPCVPPDKKGTSRRPAAPKRRFGKTKPQIGRVFSNDFEGSSPKTSITPSQSTQKRHARPAVSFFQIFVWNSSVQLIPFCWTISTHWGELFYQIVNHQCRSNLSKCSPQWAVWRAKNCAISHPPKLV